MEYERSREDFLDRMVALCRLLGIEAPPDLEGDEVAYRLDLDEITFVLQHSVFDQPDSFLAECVLGRVPTEDREASLTYLLQANLSLGQRGLGTLGLDPAGDEASCLARIDLALTDEAVPSRLLNVRGVARDWAQRFWHADAGPSELNLVRP